MDHVHPDTVSKAFPYPVFKKQEGDDAFKAVLVSKVGIVKQDNIVSEKYIFIFLGSALVVIRVALVEIFFFF